MNAYDRVFWQDHVEDESGEVIQQGTNLSEGNFNKGEVGIYDAYLAQMLLGLVYSRNMESVVDGYTSELQTEEGTVTLTNSLKFPFNSTHDNPVPVAISTRKTDNYSIELSVESVVGGIAGEVKVSSKLYNGFKLEFDGNATQVVVKYKIRGGIKY